MRQNALFENMNPPTLRPLRPRQAAAIEAIRQAVKEGHRRIVLQAPCGFGKTLTAAHLVSSSLAKGHRPLFTCPAITLVNQTLKAFEAEGIEDIGVIQADHERTDYACQMQIASVQTLIRRELPDIDFVIVDEAHLSWEKLYEKLDSEAWKDKIAIGLSATPWAKGMGLHWTKLIHAATIPELVADGHLTPFKGRGPSTGCAPDMTGAKIVAGEYQEDWAAKAMGKDYIVADVVDVWLKTRQDGSHPGDRTFLFAPTRANAQHLQDKFRAAGINFGYIDGNTPDEQRRSVFGLYRAREFKGICSVGCLITGVDEDVRCIVDAALTRSQINHVQKNGRGVRPAEGKEYLWINDHAGNNQRLGYFSDIYHDTLDCSKPGDKGDAYAGDRKPSKPKTCPKCHRLVPIGVRACPDCGETVLKNDVMTIDGELDLFGENTPAPKKSSKQRQYSMAEKQEWFSGFLGIAKERGHSEGWAAHRYKEKFSVWPNQLKKNPAPPSFEVQQFDKHCRIKYAKAKAKPAPAQEEYHAEF